MNFSREQLRVSDYSRPIMVPGLDRFFNGDFVRYLGLKNTTHMLFRIIYFYSMADIDGGIFAFSVDNIARELGRSRVCIYSALRTLLERGLIEEDYCMRAGKIYIGYKVDTEAIAERIEEQKRLTEEAKKRLSDERIAAREGQNTSVPKTASNEGKNFTKTAVRIEEQKHIAEEAKTDAERARTIEEILPTHQSHNGTACLSDARSHQAFPQRGKGDRFAVDEGAIPRADSLPAEGRLNVIAKSAQAITAESSAEWRLNGAERSSKGVVGA